MKGQTMDAVERSKVRGARDMLRECAKQLRSIDATGHAMLADMHANELGDFFGADAQAETEPGQHTPGPWKYTPREQGTGGFISEVDGAYIPIRTPFRDDAFLEGDNRSDCPEAEVVANAERIVLAVNCYDDLLDMLKAVEARISIEQQEHMDDPAPGTYCCGAIHIELLALIAKAEGI